MDFEKGPGPEMKEELNTKVLKAIEERDLDALKALAEESDGGSLSLDSATVAEFKQWLIDSLNGDDDASIYSLIGICLDIQGNESLKESDFQQALKVKVEALMDEGAAGEAWELLDTFVHNEDILGEDLVNFFNEEAAKKLAEHERDSAERKAADEMIKEEIARQDALGE